MKMPELEEAFASEAAIDKSVGFMSDIGGSLLDLGDAPLPCFHGQMCIISPRWGFCMTLSLLETFAMRVKCV